MSPLRVAVTGAAGFIGSHVCEGLAARGHEVRPLVRAVSAASPAQALALDVVLAAPAALDGTDVVIHAAAVRNRYGVDPDEYRRSNVGVVERLLAACAGRVRRFVYVSSVAVYGFPSRLPIDETFPFSTGTSYGSTKVLAETVVRRAATDLGLEWVIARPTITYGRGDTQGMLDKLATMILDGTYLVVGDGRNTLHHTHIDDMTEGLILAAEAKAAAGEHFILAGPETITLQRLSELVATRLGHRLRRAHMPLWLARAVAEIVDRAARRKWAFVDREPPVTHQKLDGMCMPIAFDGSKATRLLGFRPRVGYEDGIACTLSSRR